MWLAAWNVYENGMMMLEAAELGNLSQYRKHQDRMHRRYGPDLWPLQYQVEVRTRVEHFPRIKRDGLAEYMQAKSDIEAMGGDFSQSRQSYNPSRPYIRHSNVRETRKLLDATV